MRKTQSRRDRRAWAFSEVILSRSEQTRHPRSYINPHCVLLLTFHPSLLFFRLQCLPVSLSHSIHRGPRSSISHPLAYVPKYLPGVSSINRAGGLCGAWDHAGHSSPPPLLYDDESHIFACPSDSNPFLHARYLPSSIHQYIIVVLLMRIHALFHSSSRVGLFPLCLSILLPSNSWLYD